MLGFWWFAPPAQGFRGVEGVEALNHVLEERFSCALRHGGLQGGVLGVMRSARQELREGVEAVVRLTPAGFPSHLNQGLSFRRAPADHQANLAWG